MEILTFIFNVTIALIFKLLQIALLPIDAIITATLPTLADAFTSIGAFLTLVATGLGWAISASGLPPAIIILVALYTIFTLTIPLQLYFIKLAVKWYTTLKP